MLVKEYPVSSSAIYDKLKTSSIGMTPSYLSKSLGMSMSDVRDHLTKLVSEGKVTVDWDKGSGIPYYKVYQRPVVTVSSKTVIKVKPSRLTEFLTTLHRNITNELEIDPDNTSLGKIEKRLAHFIEKYSTTEVE